MDTHNISRDAAKTAVDTNAAQAAQASYTNEIDTPAFALNIQNQVARLSMLQAHVSKKAAADKLGELKDKQKEQNEVMSALATLRSYKGRDVHRVDIKEMEKFLKKYGIGLSFHSEHSQEYCRNEETDINIRALSSIHEQIAAQVQASMTQLQDFMGQYQSYLDGSHTASAKANEITLKLATTR